LFVYWNCSSESLSEKTGKIHFIFVKFVLNISDDLSGAKSSVDADQHRYREQYDKSAEHINK